MVQSPRANVANHIRPQDVRRVCELLKRNYGKPRLGNPKNPVDDLIFIILSNKTSAHMAQRTYERLKERFATWDDATSSRAVRTILHPAGLATIKSKQIRSALNRIQTDFGTCDLSALRKVSEDDAQHYLTALPGVSQKVAKCVMMYTLGFHVLPVDTHVHRVTKRLGWTKKNRADQCHEELEELVRPKLRYTFHVDCIAHGRAICRPSDPLCAQCPIKRYCAHFKNTKI